MDYLIADLQGILNVLPLGSWLAASPLGVIYGALFLDGLSCVIVLISRLLFKEYFSSVVRRSIFLIFAGGTAALLFACYLLVAIGSNRWYLLATSAVPDADFSLMLRYYYTIILIAYAFLTGYLVDFVIRLGRWFKRGGRGKTTFS